MLIPPASPPADARRLPGQLPPDLPPRNWLERTTRLTLFVLIGLLLVAGIGAVLASLLPYATAQAQLTRFGGMRGSASAVFTEAVFQGIVTRARVGGAALLACAVALALGRRLVQAYACGTLADLPLLTRDLAGRLRLFLVAERRIHLLALGLVTLLGAALRVAFLSQPIRYDEANTFLGSASVPLYIGLSKYLNSNNHLLNTLLMHVSYVTFGDALWAIRLPALVAGVLMIPLAYAATRALYGKQVALVTAGLVAGSSYLVEYSTNARGYTLLCAIWLAVLWLAVYLASNRHPSGFLIMGLLGGLGFYAIPTMLYPFGIVMLWLTLLALWPGGAQPRRPRVQDLATSVIAALVTTLILYSPIFVVSGVTAILGSDDLAPTRASSSAEVLARLPGLVVQVWELWNRDIPGLLQAALLLGFVLSVVCARRLGPVRIPIIGVVVGWILPLLLVQRVLPFERVWIFLLPLYLAMAVAGLGLLACWMAPAVRRYAAPSAPAVAIVVALLLAGIGVRTQSVYYSEETGVLRDAEPITLFLRDRLQPGDRVVATDTSEAPMYYYFRHWGLPFDYFVRQTSDTPAAQGTLYVIVNLSSNRHQTLDLPLNELGWQLRPGASPPILKQYDTATLYALRADEIQPESKP